MKEKIAIGVGLVLLIWFLIAMGKAHVEPIYFQVDGMTCVHIRDGVSCNWAEWEKPLSLYE